jgi:hypothetical protein
VNVRAFFGAIIFPAMLLVPACSGGGIDSDSQVDPSISAKGACDRLGLKIANGTECSASGEPGLASPVVRLLITDFNDNTVMCTGAIIDSFSVVTAVHCFVNGAKSVQIDTTSGTFFAADVIHHPNFTINFEQSIIYNDVSIVRTLKELSTDGQPILSSRLVEEGEEALVSGVGVTGDSTEPNFRAGRTVIDAATENHLFTRYEGSNANPCKGDSGGAIFVMQDGVPTIAGIVSQSSPGDGTRSCQVGDVVVYSSLLNPDTQQFIADHSSAQFN